VVPGKGGVAEPLAAAALTSGVGADAAGTRAAGIAGAMLGVLALASGLVWALYKFKPGVIPLGGAPRAGAPLIAQTPAPGATAPPTDEPDLGGAATEKSPLVPGGAAAPGDSRSVGTMAAAGYSASTGASGAGGAYARGFGVTDTSRTLQITQTMVGGGAAGAAASPTSTMNRGIQTDAAANGPLGAGGAGLAAAGGASSSTFSQSTVVKNVYSTQQAADSSFVDGSVLLLFYITFLLYFPVFRDGSRGGRAGVDHLRTPRPGWLTEVKWPHDGVNGLHIVVKRLICRCKGVRGESNRERAR